MQHQVCKSLLQPFVARVSYPVGHALRPVPNCFVRYRKKPWSPLSPTKLFRVKQRVPEDPEERARLFILHAHYKTAMKALRYTGWPGLSYIQFKTFWQMTTGSISIERFFESGLDISALNGMPMVTKLCWYRPVLNAVSDREQHACRAGVEAVLGSNALQ